jgi:hypothetical protein
MTSFTQFSHMKWDFWFSYFLCMCVWVFEIGSLCSSGWSWTLQSASECWDYSHAPSCSASFSLFPLLFCLSLCFWNDTTTLRAGCPSSYSSLEKPSWQNQRCALIAYAFLIQLSWHSRSAIIAFHVSVLLRLPL